MIPSKVIGFTTSGFNFLIADTANTTEWGGLFVRPNPSDTVLAIATGLYLFTVKDAETGDVKRGKFLVIK